MTSAFDHRLGSRSAGQVAACPPSRGARSRSTRTPMPPTAPPVIGTGRWPPVLPDMGEPGSGATVVLALQGDLDFAAAEEVLPEILALRGSGCRCVVLDTERVTRVRHVAARLLVAALADVEADG